MTHRKTQAVCLLQKPPPCNGFRQAAFKANIRVMTKARRKPWQRLHARVLITTARTGLSEPHYLAVKHKISFADRNEEERTNTMGQHSQQEGLNSSLVLCHRPAGVAGSRDSKPLISQIMNNFRAGKLVTYICVLLLPSRHIHSRQKSHWFAMKTNK